MVTIADIADGASNTYLVGEKHLNSDSYFTGTDGGDNGAFPQGANADNSRWSAASYPTSLLPPMQDTPGNSNDLCFGSAHSDAFNMAFCDSSVRAVAYTIDVETHRRLSNRKDGMPADPMKL